MFLNRKWWALLLFLPNYLVGQEADLCTLLDSRTMEPVAYASISSGLFFIYSDINGDFPVEGLTDQNLIISRIGYASVSIDISNLSDTIFMTPHMYGLNEIVVSSVTKSYEIGYHKLKTTGTAVLSENLGLGVLIANPGEYSRIVSVIISTKRSQKGDLYEINFFEVNAEGQPESLFYSKQFIASSGSNNLKIPIENNIISVPLGGMIVSVNWKGNRELKDDSRKYIYVKLTRDLNELYSYIFSRNIWGTMYSDQLDFNLNYKIGLEVTTK